MLGIDQLPCHFLLVTLHHPNIISVIVSMECVSKLRTVWVPLRRSCSVRPAVMAFVSTSAPQHVKSISGLAVFQRGLTHLALQGKSSSPPE